MKLPDIPALLALDSFQPADADPHIVIDDEICQEPCTQRSCLTVCPADVFSEHDGRIVPHPAGCLECGTCVLSCVPGALTWHYPDGSHGVRYRYG